MRWRCISVRGSRVCLHVDHVTTTPPPLPFAFARVFYDMSRSLSYDTPTKPLTTSTNSCSHGTSVEGSRNVLFRDASEIAEAACCDYIFKKGENGTPVGTIYRTVEFVSNLGATNLLGRGTRVRKVQKIVAGLAWKELYTLKDAWLHANHEPEHTITRRITEA